MSKQIDIYPNLPLDNVTMDEDDSDVNEIHPDQAGERSDSDPTFGQSGPSSKPQLVTQADLKNLVQYLNLSKVSLNHSFKIERIESSRAGLIIGYAEHCCFFFVCVWMGQQGQKKSLHTQIVTEERITDSKEEECDV